MKPADRKPIVEHLINTHQLGERKACNLTGNSRSEFRYHPQAANDESLRQRFKSPASQYPRYGYLLLHNLLKLEGLIINKKHTYHLYTEENLQVITKKRKKLTRP